MRMGRALYFDPWHPFVLHYVAPLPVCSVTRIRAIQGLSITCCTKRGQPHQQRETEAETMKSTMGALIALTTLAACGGGGTSSYTTRGAFAPIQLYATGPLQRACLSQGRKAASSQRCGCVQAVADQQLSSAEQRRGVKAFKDPHKVQVWRQSDRTTDNEFWAAWKVFGQNAERFCSSV